MALEEVLSDGSVVTLGDLGAEPAGYDLRGAFVGSEGMCGITTAAALRLTPNPAAVRTMLMAYDDVSTGAATVSAIIAAGIVPAAIEMLDRRCISAIEDFAKAGYPRDAAAVLLVEVDGPAGGVAVSADRVAQIATANGAVSVRVAADDDERARLWKGRKSAFGAVANILPDYYLHDTVVPRSRLVEVLEQVYEIADRHDLTVLNVFHAGDGNLHPILAFDARVDGTLERVHAAGREDHRGVAGGGRGAVGRARHRRGEARLHGPHVQRRRPGPAEPAAGRLRPALPAEPRQGASQRPQLRRHRLAASRRRQDLGLSEVRRT